MAATPYFHPAVAAWFGDTFAGPTPAQVDAWPAIQSGQDVLIAAPTGSGKTLAAFLAAIDALVREGAQARLPDETRVVYVSPLKALSNDINRNLEAPLAGIRQRLHEHTARDVDIRTWVRTGDTPQYERAQMRRRPPHIVVTTPESLYILLGSQSGREMLATTQTVIVDEIHAVAGSKRGSHLALSLERLDALAGRRLARIGLSATQNPVEDVARFLVGTRIDDGSGQVNCTIVDSGHARPRDLAIELPDSPLEAVMSNEVWTQIYDRLAQLIREHRTTLVFVNTRRLAERVCRHLSERLDEEVIGGQRTAHGDGEEADSGWRMVDSEEEVNRDSRVGDRQSVGAAALATTYSQRPTASRPSSVAGRRPPITSSCIAAHHGSLAKHLRFDAEQRLKRGDLKALVATASLELGIDIGDVDLVCQISSPRSINAFLQRVGRSGHAVGGTPKGRIFPLSRDDLVECAALLDAVRRGELDRLRVPENATDVLAQQIVAECAARECSEQEMFELVTRAYPYRSLTRESFDEILRMLREGFATHRGRQGALIYHDTINRVIRGRKGARLTAITSGGAIPDTADYQVLLEPDGHLVGTVNEDFAVESLSGDVFQLGNASYRIIRVERSVVRVEDARGEAPTIPFWLGEAPGRTDELSAAVSRLRREIDASFAAAGERRTADGEQGVIGGQRTADGGRKGGRRDQGIGGSQEEEVASGRKVNATGPLPRSTGEGQEGGAHAQRESLLAANPAANGQLTFLGEAAASQLTAYFSAARAALGCLPTQQTVVFERFFDEAGGMQLVIHSPFGSRINRAWGLALRKRFCRTFNFELQAAATEDTIILSLTTAHSFELIEVARYLHPNSARDILVQALLAAPMFTTRWRWGASIALALPRFRGGKRVPPQLARMNAEDLLAAVFPDQVACGENIVGDIVVPDHPLVRQTVRDCLEEAMDIGGFERLLHGLLSGEIRVEARDLTEPSPLALEVLSARPYAYLDDAPLEERRTQAVMSRRWMDPESAADIGKLDPDAIVRVKSEAWPDATSADELHDALQWMTFLTNEEIRCNEHWPSLLQELAKQGRVARLTCSAACGGRRAQEEARVATIARGENVDAHELLVAAERLTLFRRLFPDIAIAPEIMTADSKAYSREEALIEIVRGRLEALGPTTSAAIAASLGVATEDIDAALLALEAEGTAMRGAFEVPAFDASCEPHAGSLTQWCNRRLLARIHRYTVKRLRAEIDPVQPRDFLRFLFEWQRVAPSTRMQGPDSVPSVLAQLEGFDAPASAWESELLPLRIAEYDPVWLDEQCLAGRIVWTRLAPRPGDIERGAAPVRATPIALLARRHVKWWSSFIDSPPNAQLTSKAQQVAEFIRAHGASFFDEIVEHAGLLSTQVEDALSELVALGLVNSDSFGGLRALLIPADRRRSHSTPRRRRRVAIFGMQDAGRWALVNNKLRLFGGSANAQTLGGRRAALSGHTQQPPAYSPNEDPAAIEHLCRTLLARWGVVFWKLLTREADWLPPWRELLICLRRLEARGEIRGGRFVAGYSGEQFALPEAIGPLRDARRKPFADEFVSVSAADPLNLIGILTPGARLPSLTGNRVLYRDGLPVALYVGGEVRFLEALEPPAQWQAQNALLRRDVPCSTS